MKLTDLSSLTFKTIKFCLFYSVMKDDFLDIFQLFNF